MEIQRTLYRTKNVEFSPLSFTTEAPPCSPLLIDPLVALAASSSFRDRMYWSLAARRRSRAWLRANAAALLSFAGVELTGFG